MADLKVSIAGIEFKNPVLPAAGPPVRDAKAILECEKGGAGGIVTKTISQKAAPVPRPNMAVINRARILNMYSTVKDGKESVYVKTVYRMDQGFINTELWTELSLEQWIEKELPAIMKLKVPLIVSVGYTPDDMKKIIPLLKDFKIDAIEFSTHYVEPGIITDLIKTIKSIMDIPVFPKLSPHHTDLLVSQAKEAENAGADAIVAINSFGPTLHFDIYTRKPFMGSKYGFGWLSGPPIKPLAVRAVFDIARNVNIPVIGVGGISTGKDAIEHIMAGAWAVGVCTQAIIEGKNAFGRIAKEINEELEKMGFSSIEEIRGLYIKEMGKGQKVRTEGGVATLIEDKCTGCKLCERVCQYDAITMVKKEGIRHMLPNIDAKKCAACGLCVSICPTSALYLEF